MAGRITQTGLEVIRGGKSRARFTQAGLEVIRANTTPAPPPTPVSLVPSMAKLMRHGKYFTGGTEKPYWWAK